MSDPTGSNYDDDDDSRRYPRRRRKPGENPFDDIFNHFMNTFGGMDFNSLFDQMDYFLEDIFRRFGMRTPMEGDSRFPGFVWGFRMTQGPDGRPRIERFGNTPRKMTSSSGDARPSYEREPLVDVIEDTDVVRVIAEIPGVMKQEIELSATDNSLLIQAQSEDSKRKYFKELDLPCVVIPESASAKFKNGVLEVELKKIECDEKQSTKVHVE
ncbi:MAG: archaeal heat shock protein Hsp20 [Candidatus Hodarchaeota archaeon]